MRKCSLLLVLVLLMCLNSCRNKNDYLVTKSGLYYRFYQINNNNSQPKAGDVMNVEMDYAYRDSILFSSVGNVNDLRIILKEHNNDGSIHEGLAMMHVGDSASFLISPKAAYSLLGDKSLPDGIADNDKIRMDIKLINFLTREQFDEELKRIHQEKVYNAQKLVNEYVVNNGINDIPTSSGLYFHEIKEGHGINPTDGEKVKIHYVAKYINNVVFDDSSDTIVEFVLGKNQIFSGMEEGLKMMRKGGKATLVIPYDIAFGEEGNRLVPAFMPLVVDVELVDIVDAETVKNQEEKQAVQMIAKSREQFEKYVKDNKLEKNLIGNNLAYVTIAGGNGQIPMAGSKVKVHYVAKLIDGTVFDSSYDRNQPFEFVLGKGNVLLGWDMAVSRMAKGEKALCVMSQEVAYRDYSLGVIKPYSNLIYEIELIDFKN